MSLERRSQESTSLVTSIRLAIPFFGSREGVRERNDSNRPAARHGKKRAACTRPPLSVKVVVVHSLGLTGLAALAFSCENRTRTDPAWITTHSATSSHSPSASQSAWCNDLRRLWVSRSAQCARRASRGHRRARAPSAGGARAPGYGRRLAIIGRCMADGERTR
jgi:hypothetical protein